MQESSSILIPCEQFDDVLNEINLFILYLFFPAFSEIPLLTFKVNELYRVLQESSSILIPREQFDEVLNEMSVEGVVLLSGPMNNRNFTKLS